MRTANMPDQGDPIRGAEERFAAAVELGRPSSPPANTAADPALARDLELAEMLRAVAPALSPGADVKARARARVMAALALDAPSDSGIPADDRLAGDRLAGGLRLTAPESAPTEQLPVVTPAPDAPAEPAPVTAAHSAGPSTAVLTEPDLAKALRPRRRRRHALPSRPGARPGAPGIRSRIMVVGAAALLAVVAIAGGGIFASRDAVPGDPLYAIKRAAEAAGGIFTSGDASRGQRDLDLAVTRLDEIERMARSGSPDAALLQSSFQDFDAATSAGSRLVLSGADADHSTADLATWSTQATARLSALRGALPASAQPDADDALRLLDRVHRRAAALQARASCPESTSGGVDDLGPLPGPCARTATPGTSKGTDPAARTAPGSSSPQDAGAATAPQQQEQQDGGSDPALLPGVNVGTSSDDDTTPTTTSAPNSSNGKKNVDVPLPLPVPINVPPLVPGKPGLSLG